MERRSRNILIRIKLVSLRLSLVLCLCATVFLSLSLLPPRWPSGKAFASRAKDPGFESRLRRDFFGVESCQ